MTTKDITNTATNEQRNLGGSIGVGTGQQGQSINNVGVQIGHTANEFEGVAKATIGQGAIVTSDTSTGQDSLAGVNRDPLNTEIIIKDQQTAGLGIDANIDARVFTHDGRTQIIDEQKDIGKNTKKVGAITIADAVKVPAIVAAITDNGNKNPDSQNKSTLGKVKDNITVINNINHTGMSDDTAELNAKIEKIEEGGITNEMVKQVELNQLKDKFAKGTDAEDATVYINSDLTKARGGAVGTIVLGSSNETTGKDIYLDSGALNMSDGITIANGNIAPIGNTYNNANTLTEEITHSNGQGEASASKMGNLGEIVYNVGRWANSGDIAEAKGNIDTTAINSANTAQEQQEMLAANKKRLETQQDAGDAFENRQIHRKEKDLADIIYKGGLKEGWKNANGRPYTVQEIQDALRWANSTKYKEKFNDIISGRTNEEDKLFDNVAGDEYEERLWAVSPGNDGHATMTQDLSRIKKPDENLIRLIKSYSKSYGYSWDKGTYTKYTPPKQVATTPLNRSCLPSLLTQLKNIHIET